MTAPRLYKVLKDGQSCHGGKLEWSLPSAGLPGQWHEYEGVLAICASGLHVTTQPGRWWVDGCSVYEAECEGALPFEEIPTKEQQKATDKAKVVAARVRLLRRVEMIKIDKKWTVRQDEGRSRGWGDPERASA